MSPKPTIQFGVVKWLPSLSATPAECSTALVTRGGNVISVAIAAPDSRVLVPKDGVRHVSDPDAAKFGHLDSGYWDFVEAPKPTPVPALSDDDY